MGSERLAGKVLADLGGHSVLSWVVRAANSSQVFDEVIVATSDHPADDPVAQETQRLGASIHRGSQDDVLSRFVGALEPYDTDAIARLTADCPLLDPAVISLAVRTFANANVDYLSTINPRSLPRGLDVEIVSVDALLHANLHATGVDRTHVTSYVYRHPDAFRLLGLTFTPDASDLRVTIDTQDDLRALRAIVAEIGDGPHDWRELVAFLRSRPDIVALNNGVQQKAIEEG